MSEVKQGTTSRSEYFNLVDKTAGTPKTGVAPGNLTFAYTRTQQSTVAGVCSALASTAAAWSNLGAIEQDATNSPGLYRVDVPNAAYSSAAGVDTAILCVIATATASVAPALKEIQLVQNIEADVFTVVSTTGVALNWGNILNKTTANDLSGTLFSRAQSVTAVTGAVASVTGTVNAAVTSFAAGQGPRVRKNVALANFLFLMTDSTNHAPATGKTVSVTRSIDGAAFGAGTLGAVTELSSGWYYMSFGSGDLNGDVIAFRATATGCDDRNITLITNP